MMNDKGQTACYTRRSMPIVEPGNEVGSELTYAPLFSVLHPHAVRFTRILFLFLMLVVQICAQQSQSPIPSSDQAGESRSTIDCTDPAQETSTECSNPNMNTNSSRTRSLQGLDMGSQLDRANGPVDYRDTERLNGQPHLTPNQTVLPPERLTEFQKFLASSTGEILPIYGANLFRRVPSTYAPLDIVPVPPDFVIGPGDELRIRVWGQINLQTNVRVERSGDIYLPQVGPTHVANLPFSALDGQLRNAIGRVYHNFDLTVDLGQIRSIQVYLAGEARQPGLYTVSSLSTLVDALFAGGGPASQGSLRNIELRRTGQTLATFDLYSLLLHGDKSKDLKLLSGDVIYIPPVGAQVAVTGSVKVPAIYELQPNESVAQALADAGGISALASATRISIERNYNQKTRHAMEVAYDDAGLKTVLADGDLVRIYSITSQYSETVILRGHIANPGRFAWHPGMRISELIPDEESLFTRDYWWKRAQLGLPAPDFEPTPGFESMRQPTDGALIKLPRPPQRTPEDQELPQTRTPADQSAIGQQQTIDGRYISPQQRSSNSTLGEQQERLVTKSSQTDQKTSVRPLAPQVDWNYATIERIDLGTLETKLIPFDLGKLVLEHDASQDLELKSGDIVSIFSEADIRVPLAQQTKFVTLDGEFAHAGVYIAQRGETLRQLVVRAGGLTDKAYLYGSQFTRESTRVSQQSRIEEYVRNLQMSINRSNLSIAASATSSQDVATSTAGQNAEREMLSALQQIRATGRIVLRFRPGNTSIDSIPDIALENEDRFVVPPTPATVNVVGAVYNQNSFLYAEDGTLGSYLLEAGGSNKDADWRHEFVIRANGDVVSRDKKSAWRNRFESLQMNPGDSIVVPNKTFKPSALKGALDWTQLFSQLALGAAAVDVIR